MGPPYRDATARRFEASAAQARAEGKVLFGGDRIKEPAGNDYRPALVERTGRRT